jgi:hypothetical protein
VGLVLSLALAACDPDPAPPPSSPSAQSDLTRPGAAAAVVEDLIAAAGSAHAVRVELTADSATLTVVIGQTTATWAYRDGQIAAAEPDTGYIGQAIFDPRDFALQDLGGLFAQAARQAGSDKDQKLHLIEHANGRVFMSVTTIPESSAVFFRPDGSILAPLDFTTAAGLAAGLSEATAQRPSVLVVGLDPDSGGLYAIAQDLAGQGVRTVRLPAVPAHDLAETAPQGLAPFDPGLIDPQILADLIARLPALVGTPVGPVGLTVERRAGSWRPAIYLSANHQVIKATLDGAVVPA